MKNITTTLPTTVFAMKSSLIILFFLLFIDAFGQNSFDEQFRLAEELYQQENFFDAITEAKRLLFFDESGNYNYDAYNLIAQSYKQGAKFSDAIRYFTLAEINARNKDELCKARTDIIRVNILRRTTNRALKLLDSLQADKRFADKKDEITYWRGWAYIFADEWEKASLEFAKVDSAKELAVLTKQVDEELYSVTMAKTLSYIIPGAGQFYTGEYLSGLLSLGWNVLWGYITIKAIVDERIFDAVMVSNFLWLRFYRGNLQNAENFAKEKNLVISNKALHYLQNEFSGLKP